MEQTKKEFGIPGMAVAVIQDDELVYAGGVGVREINGAERVNPETVFQIGSTSKAFTAALVASVVDDGALGWKDLVRFHLPDFTMADAWVTENFQVRDLMAQHSGMKPYAGDVLVLLGYGREDVLRSMAYIEPVYSFRSEFSYVNNLWLTAATLVESKTKKSWEENLQERILDPLGMGDTSYSMEGYLGTPDAATLHVISEGEVRPLKGDWPFFNWPYVYAPAGGINSNVLDMAKWVRFQLGDGTFEGKKILTAENLSYPHHPQTPISEKDSYCMGWVKTDYEGLDLIWHNGETTGCKSLVMLVPRLDLGIVILSNLGTPAPEALGRVFVDLYTGRKSQEDHVAKAMDAWKSSMETEAENKQRPDDPYPPMDLSRYEGSYESPLFGEAEVTRRKEKLFVEVGPASHSLILSHWNRDVFSWEIEGMNLEPDPMFGTVSFIVSPDGEVTAFDITEEEGAPLSRFVRKTKKTP